MKPSRLFLSLAALGGPLATAALAQGTAFTYQGRLDDGGTPATGLYDLSFTVYNAATGGISAGTRSVDNVGVTNGLFTVTLDFGGGVFTGAPEWLEIAVRPGASTGAYTGLAPRQAVTPTPYALYAGGASATGLTGTLPSTALGGTYAGAVNFSNKGNTFAGNAVGLTNLNAATLTGTLADARLSANVPLLNAANRFTGANNTFGGNVGIGTATPAAKLDVNGNIVSSGGITVNSTGSGTMNISDLAGDAGKSWFLYNGYYGNGNFAIARHDPALGGFPADRNIFINPAGNVGIGTVSPGAKLDVNGVARFGGGVQAGTGVAYGLHGDGGNLGLRAANGGRIFFTGADGGGSVMVWDPNLGKLGLGTDTPGTTLDVAGEITCTALNVTSDRNAKEKFKAVNPREVLAKVVDLPITEWQYKSAGEARHMGPMAQDFHAAFALGHDEKHITSVDEDGVALAAIQGLNEKLEEKAAEVSRLKAENQTLANRLAAIERALGLAADAATK